MVKSLYKIAETYDKMLTKTAHSFRDYEYGENDMVDTEISGRENHRGPSGEISEREDILPEFKSELEETDDDDYLERAYKRLEKDDEMEEFDTEPRETSLMRRHQKAQKDKSRVVKMAILYATAAKDSDTKGAYIENLEDVPIDDESMELGSLMKDTGYSEPEDELFQGGGEIETKSDDEEDSGDFGDPGEYMPLTDEQAEQAASDKARRLALIRERHQAFLDKEDEPMHSEKDEDETLEEELAETEADELAEEEELEEDELPAEFEDEDEVKCPRSSAHNDFLEMGATPWEKREDEE